jgi:hypothetical protein
VTGPSIEASSAVSRPEPSPVTKELAGRLLTRVEDLALVLRDTIMDKDPLYATTDLVTSHELLRSCRHNMLRSLQALSGQVPDDVDLFDAARRSARRRADTGFPLDSLLHAFRLGTEVIWNALLDEARNRAPYAVDELLDGAVQVMQLMDVMSLAAAGAYRDRQLELQRRDTERRQAVLDSLLEGRGVDPDVAAEARRLLDLPEDPRLAVVVLRHPSLDALPARSPAEALAAHGLRSEWQLRADREVGLVVLGTASLERLVTRLRSIVDGPAAVSNVIVGLAEVPTALRLAELTLDTLPADATLVETLDERLPEVLLKASLPVAQRLRERALGELLDLDDDKQATLLQTVDCWFRHNRSALDVGNELHCHRNTVLNRLNRVEALTGLRLEDSRDELLLRLALLTS